MATAGAIDFPQGTQPANPASGDTRVWVDDDGNVYKLLSDGTNSSLAAGMSSFDLAADTGTAETVEDSETVTVEGGTGIDTNVAATNTVTVAIDSTVATLTGAQTLTNKTLTSPTVSGGTVDNAVIGGTTPAAGDFTDVGVSGDVEMATGGELRFNDAAGIMRGQFALNEVGTTRMQLNMYSTTTYLGTPFEFDATTNATRFFGNASFGFGSLTLGVDTAPDANTTRSLGSTSLRWLKGWFTDIDSTNAVNVSSDRRFKRDITRITPAEGLAFILSLNPSTYKREDDEQGQTHMGFVAQDVEDALLDNGYANSSIVQRDDEGNLSLRYTEIIAMQAAAIQALEARITQLERMVRHGN
jgi:hypothetical protein